MKRKSLKVFVKQGIIEVNSALVLIETKDVIWIFLDTAQKYPRVGECWQQVATLVADKRTLRADRKLPATEVSVNLRGEHWTPFFELGKNSISLIYVRRPTKHGRFILHTVGTARKI